MAFQLANEPVTYGPTKYAVGMVDSSSGFQSATIPAMSDGTTLMCWFKAGSIGSSTYRRIFYLAAGFGSSFQLFLDLSVPAHGRIVLYWPDSTYNGPDMSLSEGVWYHFSLCLKDSNISLYLDGVLIYSADPVASTVLSQKIEFSDGNADGDQWYDICIADKYFPAETIAWYYADRLTAGANSLPPGA